MSLRRDPRILKLPPYLSFLCVVVGVIWLLVLPLDDFSRRTYISENALLPGQVHTYFGGTEHNVLRAYRHEVNALVDKDNYEINDKLEEVLKGLGVKVGRQSYAYRAGGNEYRGENVYGILQAPRGDATEAMVLVAAWKSIDGDLNRNGVSLALTLARYFKRWSLWSKDIIILFPPDSQTGTQAWVDAYHDAHDPNQVAPLPLKSGALQGALAIDYAQERRFQYMHVIYDGANGQLPNLDLINSIINIAGGQMGINSYIQGMRHHTGNYKHRLWTLLRGMFSQSLGNSAGPHSSFIPYHVDAVTLQPSGRGFHDEMAMGRVVEGTFRSLNNLLEHLHQSFFFYLLVQRDRFVSIGTYLPSAMLLAANFTIMAIFLWTKSGQLPITSESSGESPGISSKGKARDADTSVVGERDLVLPLGIVAACHSLAAIPVYLFNHLPLEILPASFAAFSALSAAVPLIISYLILPRYKPTVQHSQLTKSCSLLTLGMGLSTLATLNFSLAFVVGLLATPLTFVKPTKSQPVKLATAALLNLVAPPVVIYAVTTIFGADVAYILREASFGWNVWGLYTPVAVWALWWPAWTIGMVNVLGLVPE
ncbi:GPI-anchor transamidase subunit GAA1 [Geosmithia morbida]|uniref:GPI-anchor transamidase subunit GAA1 n=1 Tax=Geosmithia morbida TaxID=1094350 RepID=A0A9P4YR62_9HYPO|nr:GPI-anchor transamidase subunit GAA1 [Geosmithia morbida]KAF4121598.1 GPI-anchor transamidase subunit GAA1 [Geosmithia morbida]